MTKKGFPKPKGVKTPVRGDVPPVEPEVPVEGETSLTVDNIGTILNSTLLPQHREDPTVIKFINAYLTTRDLGDAALAAGIDKRSARTLRDRRDIHKAIVAVTDASLLKYGLDPNEIVEKVKAVAYFDPIDLVNKDGTFKTNLHDMSADARRAIKSIKIKTLYATDLNGMKVKSGHVAELTFWDKMKALEFLGREKSLFKETVKQEFDVTDNMKDVLLESRNRSEERLARLNAREKEVIDVSPNSTSKPGDRVIEPGDRGDNDSPSEASKGVHVSASNTLRLPGGQDEMGDKSTEETE